MYCRHFLRYREEKEMLRRSRVEARDGRVSRIIEIDGGWREEVGRRRAWLH